MLPTPPEILKRLHLQQAAEDEAASWQSLLPPPPGWDEITASSRPFAEWLSGQLAAGVPAAPQVVVSARKAQHGVRPVPVWGFAERVAYRALVNFVLRNEPELDRSPETYLQFIGGPVEYAREAEPTQGPGFYIGSSVVHYVVKADITAFYEYVDHGILSRELLTRIGDHAAIEVLMSLLAEVEGRSFGLPQLLDPSDRLSEVYIDMVERDVLRRGWPAWRFNDDFRIAVRDFGAALAAVEDLAAAAREVGLSLSDVKTTTPRFSTYVLENFGLQVDDEMPDELRRHDPEDFVGDYTEGVGETDPSWAVELLAGTNVPDKSGTTGIEDGINLRALRGDDHRRLSRALGRLIRAGVPDALPYVVKLIVYVPSLTPRAVRYIVAAGAAQQETADVLDEIVDKVSLSDWQRAWIVRAFDDLGLLATTAPGDAHARTDWVASLRRGRHGPIVAAEAALALAGVEAVEFADVEFALRNQPAVTAPWYLTGIRRLHMLGRGSNKQYAAVRGEGGIYAALLPELP